MSLPSDNERDELVRKANILEMTLENMAQGVSMFDADLNVVVFNRRFLEILGFPAGRFQPGDNFEDFIRYNAERGEYGEGDIEDQVRMRLDLVKRFEPRAIERTRPDGTVVEIRGWPVPGGGFLTTYTDVTERRKAEQALKESEERYALAGQAVTEGVYDWNIETGEIYYSPRVKAMLGLSPDDRGTVEDWSHRIHPDDRPKFQTAIKAHLKGDTERFELDYRYRAKDGTRRWARQHGFALRNEDGRAVRMAGSTGDITEQKEMERALEAVRAQLSATIESVPAGVSLFDTDDRLVLCNSRVKALYPGLADIMEPGLPFEESIRTVAARGIAADSVGRYEEWIEGRLERHRNPGQPFLQRQSDGRWIQIDERRTDDGGTVAVYTDVTGLKRHEEELAEAIREKDAVLAEFSAVMDTIDHAVLFVGPDLRARLINRAFGEKLAVFPKELLERRPTLRELMESVHKQGLYTFPDEEFDEYARQRVDAVKKGDIPPVDLHFSDGRVFEYQCKSLPDGGRMLTYFEITAYRRAEEALRESEKRFKDIASASSDSFWEMGPDLRFTHVSGRIIESAKLSPSRVIGKTRKEFGGVDDETWARYLADTDARRAFKDFRYRIESDRGETMWMSVSGVPIFDDHGEFKGYRGTTTDITGLVLAQQEAKRAEERLTDAIESISEGFALYDADDRLVVRNSHYEAQYPGLADIVAPGTSFERIIRTGTERGLFADAVGREEAWIEERLARHREVVPPFLQLQSDDRWIQISERSTSDGGRVAVFTDVTELKRQEKALRQAIAEKDAVLGEFNAVMDTIEYGVLFMGPDLRARIMNRAFAEKVAMFPKELLARRPSMRELMESFREQGLYPFPDEEFDAYARQRIEAVRKGDILPVDFHLSDGRVFEYQCKSLSDGGRMVTYFDITAHKQAEDALSEKNRMLENLSVKLSKYLAPQVYASIFTGEQSVEIASRRKKLTIFFSDIAGFTETTDLLESEELTSLLNHYLTEMSKIALEYGATIDKYVGDAMMLFFGDPETRGSKEDAVACVTMAIAMQRRMRELQSAWRDRGLEHPFQLRIGINSGYCTVGNFGSEDRMDYTIIGNEVNLAARLQSHAELGGVLLAHETYSLVKDTVAAEEQEPIQVKGFSKPVRTYRVAGTLDDLIEQGRIVRKEEEGLSLRVDLDKQDRAAAIKAVEDFLSALKS